MRPSLPEYKRLSRQCEQILERLKSGPATNAELAAISLNYTARVSDLRVAGWDVPVVSQDRRSGVTIYALRGRIDPGQMPLSFLPTTSEVGFLTVKPEYRP